MVTMVSMVTMVQSQSSYGNLVLMGSSGCCSFGVNNGVGIFGTEITTINATRAGCRKACTITYDQYCGGMQYNVDQSSCVLFADLPLDNRNAVYCMQRRCYYRIGFGIGWSSTQTTSMTTTAVSTVAPVTDGSTSDTTTPITTQSVIDTTTPITTETTSPITQPSTTETTSPITSQTSTATSTLTSSASTTQTTTPYVAPCAVDIVLLVDTSLSIFRIFDHIQTVAIRIAQLALIQDDTVRIAVVSFNDVQTVEFDFDDHGNNITAITAAISAIQLDQVSLPGTEIESALAFTVTTLMADASRGFRGGLPIFIIISDHDTAPTRAVADTAGAYVSVLEID